MQGVAVSAGIGSTDDIAAQGAGRGAVANSIGINSVDDIAVANVQGLTRTFTQNEIIGMLDEAGEVVTLYRGITGSESGGGALFLTLEDEAYAMAYAKTNIVKSIQIPKITYERLRYEGIIEQWHGSHGPTGMSGIEIKVIDPVLKKILVNRLK